MFGDIVREHRRRLGLSQEELAGKCAVTERGLRRIESGQTTTPRPVTVRLLADAFGLTGVVRDRFIAAAHPRSVDRSERRAAAPAQLPADLTGFVGRAEPLRQLDILLDRGSDHPTAATVAAVVGAAGIGKTTLASHWAHRVRDRFPDGQLYINLRGFDPAATALDPADVIRRFLDALAIPVERIPADVGAQGDLYRTQLADRTMLIVLDNARDADHVRPLLPGAPGCMVLVTSRNQLTSLIAAEGAKPVQLDLLNPAEARDLFARRLGPDRVNTEPDAVDELVSACAGLPLALAIVAANAATQPHQPLSVLADRLRHRRERLGAMATGDAAATDLRAVFSWSYQALSEKPARLFRLLGLHPGPDISTAATASLAAIPVDLARALLERLNQAHLITEAAPDRYTFHDLVRAYAAELTVTVDSGDERHTAIGRLLDHYLESACAAAIVLSPARDPITIAPARSGVTAKQSSHHDDAFAWFVAERATLLALVDHAAATGFDTHVWQLAWAVFDFLDRRGDWHELAATQRTALAAARRLNDTTAQARAHRYLAHALLYLGKYEDAEIELRRAMDLFHRTGDLTGQAHTLITLGSLCERQGRFAEALNHARQSLDLFERAGDRGRQAIALNGVGWCHALLGDYEQAIVWCERSLTLLQQFDNPFARSSTWDTIGYAHHHLGNYDEAIRCYQHALDLVQKLGDRYSESLAQTHIGATHQAAGNLVGAREAWENALSILDELHHPDADEVRASLRSLSE